MLASVVNYTVAVTYFHAGSETSDFCKVACTSGVAYNLLILHFRQEYEEDSNSEPDVDLENQYYNSKAIKENDPNGALESFQKVAIPKDVFPNYHRAFLDKD